MWRGRVLEVFNRALLVRRRTERVCKRYSMRPLDLVLYMFSERFVIVGYPYSFTYCAFTGKT